jgi:hypothetical protein
MVWPLTNLVRKFSIPVSVAFPMMHSQREASDSMKTYEPPQARRLGTLAELTLQTQDSFAECSDAFQVCAADTSVRSFS